MNLGLFILIILGVFYIITTNNINYQNLFKLSPKDIPNILAGAFIFIFAYTGFELVIRLNSETINTNDNTNDNSDNNNEKNNAIPNAIHDSLLFIIIIYPI